MSADPLEKIAITGANGFVGHALLNALLAQGKWHILAITRRPLKLDTALVENHCTAAQNPDLKGVDVLIHLAARVHVMNEKSADPLAAFRQVNVQGTLQLATAAAQAGVRRFVFISTAKVNGESTIPGKPFSEEDAANPQDAYSVSKWEAEQELMAIARDTGMEVVIIRPPLVYGPSVKANFAALMRAVQRGIPLPLGAVRNARSLVGLDNLVDFITVCMSHPAAANQNFLVSDGSDVSTSELVRTMANAVGVADRQIVLPVWCLQWLGKITGKSAAVDRLCGNLQLDISKAQTLLSWVPQVSLEEGIRRAMSAQQVAARV
jgi:nucleoside-diphosphate-sugar epimerase